MKSTKALQSCAGRHQGRQASCAARLLAVTMLVCIPVFMLQAGQPQVQKGSKSVYFGFNGLADMKMDNAYFQAQYLFADRKGITAGFHLGGTKTDLGNNIKPTKTSDFTFDVEYIYYAWADGPVTIYCGPGIGFTTAKNEYPASPTKALMKENTNGISVFGFIGVEWWAWDNVTISISTLFGYQSLKSTVKSDDTGTKTTTTTSTWGNLSSGSTSVGVGFYF